MVVLLLGGADVAARNYAEDELTSRVHTALGARATGETDAAIDSFPFLGRLAALGTIDEITVHQAAVDARGIHFTTIDVDLRGVHLDRGQLLRTRHVELTGIDRGTVTAVIGLGELLRLAGQTLTGGIHLEDGVLVIGDVRIDLAGAPLLPCASHLRIEGASVIVTCTLHDPPVELLDKAA